MKTTTAIIIFIIAVALLAAGLWWWVPKQEKDNLSKENEWQTYTNEEFSFSLSHPADWLVFEDKEGFTPIINIYPESTTEKPPFIHHNNVTMVSVFPHGVPTEGIISETVPSAVNFAETPIIAIDFLFEDGTVWATYSAFGPQAPNWEESGFVFGRNRIQSEQTTCTRDGAEIPAELCDPFTGDLVMLTGVIDSEEQTIVAKILKSFHFTERTTKLEYNDLVRLTSPLPPEIIKSPLTVSGEARGTWFFEASFPLILTDWDGKIIAEGHAQAQPNRDGEVNWMTTEYVPFEGTLVFDTPQYGDIGALILRKDNPSGLPEHDDAFEVRVRYR